MLPPPRPRKQLQLYLGNMLTGILTITKPVSKLVKVTTTRWLDLNTLVNAGAIPNIVTQQTFKLPNLIATRNVPQTQMKYVVVEIDYLHINLRRKPQNQQRRQSKSNGNHNLNFNFINRKFDSYAGTFILEVYRNAGAIHNIVTQQTFKLPNPIVTSRDVYMTPWKTILVPSNIDKMETPTITKPVSKRVKIIITRWPVLNILVNAGAILTTETQQAFKLPNRIATNPVPPMQMKHVEVETDYLHTKEVSNHNNICFL
ncbi:hypothetical protein HDU76_009404 [Blyttiomyces sp. JEL0837]|nr:hypothetical protein HDU76_009404 [Blyttiomyces sp. JEL0837]